MLRNTKVNTTTIDVQKYKSKNNKNICSII